LDEDVLDPNVFVSAVLKLNSYLFSSFGGVISTAACSNPPSPSKRF